MKVMRIWYSSLPGLSPGAAGPLLNTVIITVTALTSAPVCQGLSPVEGEGPRDDIACPGSQLASPSSGI